MRFIAIFVVASGVCRAPAAAASSPSLSSLEQQLSSWSPASPPTSASPRSTSTPARPSASRATRPSRWRARSRSRSPRSIFRRSITASRSLDDTINGQSARSLMARMLIHSDNRATDMLLKDLGGPTALHDWLQQNGVTGLRVDRTIAQLLSDKRDLWDRRDSSTPMAMVDLLRRIYKAELIKPESRNYLLDLMAQCQTGKNRMKALLPRRAGRAQDRHAQRPDRRCRLHHHARRPSRRGRDLHARRKRPPAHHRRGGAGDLRRLQVGP